MSDFTRYLFFFVALTSNLDILMAQNGQDGTGFDLLVMILLGVGIFLLGFLLGVCCTCIQMRVAKRTKGRITPTTQDQKILKKALETGFITLRSTLHNDTQFEEEIHTENRQTYDSIEEKQDEPQLGQSQETTLNDSAPLKYNYEHLQNRTDAESENIYDIIGVDSSEIHTPERKLKSKSHSETI